MAGKQHRSLGCEPRFTQRRPYFADHHARRTTWTDPPSVNTPPLENLYEPQKGAHTTHFSRSIKPPSHIRALRRWADHCDSFHGASCAPKRAFQRPRNPVPHWLIDIQDMCIVRGSSSHRYLALSYTWPEKQCASTTSPQSLMLETSNLDAFQRTGFLELDEIWIRLPNIIKHALQVTISLDERFFWCDRLCILQNDIKTQSQVECMDQIYGGAYLTIIAAAPECMYKKRAPFLEWGHCAEKYCDDCLSPAERGNVYDRQDLAAYKWKVRQQVSAATSRPASSLKTHRPIITFPPSESVAMHYEELAGSKWATRGWTYQEHILCTRAVFFVQQGMFWDCQRCMWDGEGLVPAILNSLRTKTTSRFSNAWPDFSFYLNLVCPYNGRELSNPADGLKAFSGILNAMSPAFPGGFISGLPRVFLDHALLWQPLGVGFRRIDQCKDGRSRSLSRLPSWAWCGWQCVIGPQSLVSGMAYIDRDECQKVVGSWRTKKLVVWYASDGANGPWMRVSEATHLDACVETGRLRISPPGWSYHDRSHWTSSGSRSYFTHDDCPKARFKHPVPLNRNQEERTPLAGLSYLKCFTTTASFQPAAVLGTGDDRRWYDGEVSLTVFKYKFAPKNVVKCPVLVLQHNNGEFAGMLRLINHDRIRSGTRVELIAVSTGSASGRDFRQSYEWTALAQSQTSIRSENVHGGFRASKVYEYGERVLSSDLAIAFGKRGANDTLAGQKPIKKRHGRLKRRSEDPYVSCDPELCEFYNVLWIERRGNIAYRRACGWVSRYVWEANAYGPMEVILG